MVPATVGTWPSSVALRARSVRASRAASASHRCGSSGVVPPRPGPARTAQDLQGQRRPPGQLLPLIEADPPVRGRRGRPCCRPVKVFADRAYDHDKYRALVAAKGIRRVIARRGIPHGSGWASTDTCWSRPSRCCTVSAGCGSAGEVRDDIHEAFPTIGCTIICCAASRSTHCVRTSKRRSSASFASGLRSLPSHESAALKMLAGSVRAHVGLSGVSTICLLGLTKLARLSWSFA